MTVRQIALSAAAVLQADDIQTALTVTTDPPEELTDPDALTLVKCVNLAAAETASDFPCTVSTDAESRDGLIPFSALGEADTVREVTRNGRAVRFSTDSRGIRTPRDGKYTVTYTKPYAHVGADDELVAGAGADAEMLTYLAARNFCLITGRTDEASVWDQRYNAEAENKRLRRRATLPRRTWLL